MATGKNNVLSIEEQQITMEFSSEIIEVKRKWNYILKVWNERNSFRILYSVNISCRKKTVSNEGKLRALIIRRPALKKVVKEILQMREK